MTQEADGRWQAVVEAEATYASALARLNPDALPGVLSAALGTIAGRRAALRVLGDSPTSLTEDVFPALETLLLVSHSMLAEARRIVCRLPDDRLSELLDGLSSRVVGDDSAGYEAYRRLAELLRLSDQRHLLRRLIDSAAESDDPDIREVAVDFEAGSER